MHEAVGYVVELKNEETEKAIVVEMPSTATSFVCTRILVSS